MRPAAPLQPSRAGFSDGPGGAGAAGVQDAAALRHAAVHAPSAQRLCAAALVGLERETRARRLDGQRRHQDRKMHHFFC